MWAKGFPDRANAFPGSWNYTGCCISPYSFVPINIYSVDCSFTIDFKPLLKIDMWSMDKSNNPSDGRFTR